MLSTHVASIQSMADLYRLDSVRRHGHHHAINDEKMNPGVVDAPGHDLGRGRETP